MLDTTNMKRLAAPQKKPKTKQAMAYVNKWGTVMINREAMSAFDTDDGLFAVDVFIKSTDSGINLALSSDVKPDENGFLGKVSAKSGRGTIYVGKDNLTGIYALPKQRPETVIHNNGIELIFKR